MSTATNALAITLPSDTEIVMTRTFDAPRRLVFEAFTKCEHVSRWWGCRQSTLSSCKMEFRSGGAWRFVSRMADGSEYPFKGVYREIVEPERISQTFIFDVEPFNAHESVETMVFTEQDGRTTITGTCVYESKEIRDAVLQSGMENGAGESDDRLEELLRELA